MFQFWHTIQPSSKLFRWRAIIVLSSEPHAGREKVQLCKTMVKTARDVGGAMVASYCLKQNSSGSKNYCNINSSQGKKCKKLCRENLHDLLGTECRRVENLGRHSFLSTAY